jgi:hypothetical protein
MARADCHAQGLRLATPGMAGSTEAMAEIIVTKALIERCKEKLQDLRDKYAAPADLKSIMAKETAVRPAISTIIRAGIPAAASAQ